MRGGLVAVGGGLLAFTAGGCEAVIGSHDLMLARTDAGLARDGDLPDAVGDDANDEGADDASNDGTMVQGELVGADSTPTSVVDLTMQGTSDWAHWGLATAASFSTKMGGGGQISSATVIGAVPANRNTAGAIGFSWVDGNPPDTQADASTTSIYVTGIGDGLRFAVPAGTSSRVLKVFVGGSDATGSFVAHLSDESAPDYTNANHSGTRFGFDVVFTLTYNAASPGQMLLVSWTMSAGKPAGFVTLESAALQ